VIDPVQRWREYGEKPDFAGPLSFGGVPMTQDSRDLDGADVAIVGAPIDELRLRSLWDALRTARDSGCELPARSPFRG
jgi:hypothetical protein